MLAASVGAQAPPPASAYLSQAAAPDYNAQLLVALGPVQSLDAFDFELTFDPTIVELGDVRLDGSWALDTLSPSDEPGVVRIAGHANTPCTSSSTCLIGTLHFRPLSEGQSALNFRSAQFSDAGSNIELVPVGGSITVPANFVETAENPALGPTPDASESSTDSGSSSLFSGILPAALFLVVIATVLAGGAFIVVAVARRTWRWSDTRPRQSAASEIDPAIAAALESRVEDYLAELEAAAEVAATDPDLLTRSTVPRTDEP